VTKNVEHIGGSARPERSPELHPQYSPDHYDLSNVGDKSKTRSQQSIKLPIQDDPAIRARGVQGDLEDADQEGNVADNVRDDVQTAGGDTPDKGRQNEGGEENYTIVTAKKADGANGDTDETVGDEPKVPRDEEGGEEDPVQRMIETGRRRSKMTKQELFDNQSRNKLFKAMHESTYQEDVENKTYQRNRSCAETHHMMSAMHESTYKRDVQYKAYQEDGNIAKNMMKMILHHPRVCQNQTASQTLTMIRGASRRHGEDQEDPLRHGGRGGHN
jgi:hypothetical protein